MKFPELNDKSFTTDEIKLLNTWQERMKQNPIGKRIIKNMEKDSNVPEDIWRKFLKNLVERLKTGDSEFRAAKNSITHDMLLKGPPIDKENLPEQFSMLIKVRSLFRYLKDNIPIFRDIENHRQIFNWIESKTITIKESFKKIKLQGRQPVCWAMFKDDLDKSWDITGEPNKFYDILGLWDFDDGDYVVELLYDSKKIKNPRIPTIIEAGIYPIFFLPFEDDEYGYTLDLDFWDFGIPEIVHEPIPFQDISLMIGKFQKSETPVSLYKRSDFRHKKFKEIIDLKKAVLAVEKRDEEEMMKYIEERLKGTTFIPTISPHSNQPPEYFLEKIYERGQDPQFKPRFRSAIAKLLKREKIGDFNPDFLASLLIFCEQYGITEAVVSIADMISSEELKGKQSIYGDLHLRALMAFARMPQGKKMTALWVEAIEDERYTAAAFTALREQGLEKIIKYLPLFIKMFERKPESIDMKIALLTLYDDYKNDLHEEEITRLILKTVKDETPVVKSCLNKKLKSIGRKLSLKELSKSQFDDAYIEELKERYPRTIDALIEHYKDNPNRSFLGNIEFVLLYIEIEEIEKAYWLLNESFHRPVDLDKVIKLLPSSPKNVELYSLKSRLCCKLLSYIEFETDQVIRDIGAWRLIAILEKNLSRQEKWAEIVFQVEQGKFRGVRY